MRESGEQLCWSCQNARADRCCWIGNRKAVKGWKAKVVPCMCSNQKIRPTYTYRIKKCPNYVKEPTKISKTKYLELLSKKTGIGVRTLYRKMELINENI